MGFIPVQSIVHQHVPYGRGYFTRHSVLSGRFQDGVPYMSMYREISLLDDIFSMKKISISISISLFYGNCQCFIAVGLFLKRYLFNPMSLLFLIIPIITCSFYYLPMLLNSGFWIVVSLKDGQS